MIVKVEFKVPSRVITIQLQNITAVVTKKSQLCPDSQGTPQLVSILKCSRQLVVVARFVTDSLILDSDAVLSLTKYWPVPTSEFALTATYEASTTWYYS